MFERSALATRVFPIECPLCGFMIAREDDLEFHGPEVCDTLAREEDDADDPTENA